MKKCRDWENCKSGNNKSLCNGGGKRRPISQHYTERSNGEKYVRFLRKRDEGFAGFISKKMSS